MGVSPAVSTWILPPLDLCLTPFCLLDLGCFFWWTPLLCCTVLGTASFFLAVVVAVCEQAISLSPSILSASLSVCSPATPAILSDEGHRGEISRLSPFRSLCISLPILFFCDFLLRLLLILAISPFSVRSLCLSHSVPSRSSLNPPVRRRAHRARLCRRHVAWRGGAGAACGWETPDEVVGGCRRREFGGEMQAWGNAGEEREERSRASVLDEILFGFCSFSEDLWCSLVFSYDSFS